MNNKQWHKNEDIHQNIDEYPTWPIYSSKMDTGSWAFNLLKKADPTVPLNYSDTRNPEKLDAQSSSSSFSSYKENC